MKKETDKYQQSRNILRAYSLIATKGVVSLNEISEYLYPDLNEESRKTKHRSVQRIADILVQEMFIQKIIRPRNQGNLYKFNKQIEIRSSGQKLTSGEILSFNFVKAFMKGFEDTTLADDFENLSNKIDAISPDEFLPEDSIVTLQQPGIYESDLKRDLLLFLLQRINEKVWINITYKTQYLGKIKETEVLPLHIIIYEGLVYLIAYNSSARKYLVYSVHNILKYQESSKQDHRFIEFDLRTWINRWGEAIIDIQPIELKNSVIESLRANLSALMRV